jgi:sulfonate transport system substrate-binding protein
MSETLTLIRPKAEIGFANPQLKYSTSVDVPTVSALATHLGLLDEEFATEFELDVIFSREDLSAKGAGNGYWIRDAGLIPSMRARASGGDSQLIALAFLDVSAPMVTLTTSGIRSVADLKGKRLGIATTQDGFRDLGYAQQLKVYTTALSSVGLTLHDVRFVPFQSDQSDPTAFRPWGKKTKTKLEIGKDIAERLQRHEFDAIAVETASDVAHHVSTRVLYDTLEHPDYLARAHADTLRGVVVSGHLLRERRDLVVRVLARLLQAADWIKARPKDATDGLADSFNTNFDHLTGKYQNLSEGLQINLGVEKILSLKAQKNFLLRHRLFSNDFDINPWIDHGPLVEAHLLYADWKKEGRIP